MPDKHIDYWEVSEYGRHFVREVARLESEPNEYVNVTGIKNRVLGDVEQVEALRSTSVVQGSDLRGDRGGLEQAASNMQHVIHRYYHYLRSLPAGTSMDMEAFFPGGMLGDIVKYKPADLLARADDLMSGFESQKNSAIPDATSWKTEFEVAHAELAAAISGTGNQRTQGRVAGGQLASARKAFLRSYNGMAKRVVYALLLSLDREHEYRSFFLDLQVNEQGSPESENPDGESGDLPADEPAGESSPGTIGGSING